MLYYAAATMDVGGGIQVTGSHNPADYNGFKMVLNGRSVFGEEIQALGRRAAAGDWNDGKRGTVTDADILDEYVDRLVEGLRRQGVPHRLGRRQWRRRAKRSSGCSPSSPASITRSTPRSTAPSPTTIPTRPSKPISPT